MTNDTTSTKESDSTQEKTGGGWTGRLVLGSSETPRTDDTEIEMDKADLKPLLKLPLYANLARNLEKENRAMFMAGYSARYILEELNNEPGMWQMAKLTGLPMGVIVSAFENIFAGSEISSENSGIK